MKVQHPRTRRKPARLNRIRVKPGEHEIPDSPFYPEVSFVKLRGRRKTVIRQNAARAPGSPKFALVSCFVFILTTVLLAPRIVFLQSSSKETQQQQDLPLISELTRPLNGGETHSYRLALNVGEFFYALVEQQGIDVVIDLFDPTGKHIADADSPNDNWDSEPILLIANTTGNYRVDISSTNKKAPAGRYAIKLIALRHPTSVDKAHVAAEDAFDAGRRLRSQGTVASRR